MMKKPKKTKAEPAGAHGQKKLYRLLENYMKENSVPGDSQKALMGVLHKVQTLFGYLPKETMSFVAKKLSVPEAHVYGMATFYNYFSLTPRARYEIQVCKGTACYVSGGAKILSQLKEKLGIGEGEVTEDGKFSLGITRCLGCCGLSPVMQVNEDVHVRMVPEKVTAILKQYGGANHGRSHCACRETPVRRKA